MHIDQASIAGVLSATTELAVSRDPWRAMLVSDALYRLRDADAPISELAGQVSRISDALSGALSMAERHDVFLSREAVALGLDRRLATEISLGTISVYKQQLVATPTGGRWDRCLIRQSAGQVGRDWAAVAGDVAQRDCITALALAAMGKTSAPSLDQYEIENLVDADTADQWKIFKGNLFGDSINVDSFATELGKLARGRLQESLHQLSVESTFSSVRDWLDRRTPENQIGTGLEPSAPWRSLGAYSSGTGILLIMAGRQDLAKKLDSAFRFTNSAIQVYEAATMLLSATSGWGMGMAVMGLAGGMGGLNAADGGQQASNNERREIFEALQAMFTNMQQQFGRLNEKLDTILSSLGEMAQQLAEVQLTSQETLLRVKRIEEQINGLYLVVGLGTKSLSEQIFAVGAQQCYSTVDRGDREDARKDMKLCTKTFADHANDSNKFPLQILPANNLSPADIARQLDGVYSSRINGDSDRWSSLDLLKVLLEGVGARKWLGESVHLPMVIGAIENYSALVRMERSEYLKLSSQVRDRDLKVLRGRLEQCLELTNALRGKADAKTWTDVPILNDLVELAQKIIEGLPQQWLELRKTAVERLIDGIRKQADGYLRRSGVWERTNWTFYDPRSNTWSGVGLPKVTEVDPIFFTSVAGDSPRLVLEILDFQVVHEKSHISTDSSYNLHHFTLKIRPTIGDVDLGVVDAVSGTFQIRLEVWPEVKAEGAMGWRNYHAAMAKHGYLEVASAAIGAIGAKLSTPASIETAKKIFYDSLIDMELADCEVAAILNGSTSQGLEFHARIDRLCAIVIAVRCVCTLGSADAYAVDDVLQSLLEGASSTAVATWKTVDDWVHGVSSLEASLAGGVATGSLTAAQRLAIGEYDEAIGFPFPLPELLSRRLLLLQDSLDSFVKASSECAESFRVARARTLVEELAQVS